MKLLYLVPYVPNRIRVRPYELLCTLAQRGHQITLVTLWNTAQEQAELQALTQQGITLLTQPLPTYRSLWNCVQALPTHRPLQAAYCWQPALARQLQRLLQTTTFDLIHVEHLRGAAYGLALKRALPQATATPIIWDSVDCISHLFRQAAQQSKRPVSRLLTRFELRRTAAYEGWLARQFARVLLTSHVDRQALSDLAVQAGGCIDDLAQRLVVLPNGVNLDYFCPADEGASPQNYNRRPATLIFSGKMSYHANVTAVLHLVQAIMPLVWQQRPDVNVQIVGKDPPPVVRALATTPTYARGGIEVTGTVPAIPPYLRQATIAVAPVLYSAGIQNKVLEAMACATPVVATPQAVAAIDVPPGEVFYQAATPQHFAEQILALLCDRQRCQQLGAAGRRYVEQHHAWPMIVTQLEQIYQTARAHCNLGT